MIVIASCYGLFAIMGGSPAALPLEWVAIGGFLVVFLLGFKINLWFVVAARFAHGVFDFFPGHLIANPGVPVWWPGFCLTYDVTGRRLSGLDAVERPHRRLTVTGNPGQRSGVNSLECKKPPLYPSLWGNTQTRET